MDLNKDFMEIVKRELSDNKVEFSEEWDDHKICMIYLEVRQRMFDSSIPYKVVFSDVLLKKITSLDRAEQEAIKDIIKRLEECESLEPYMSKLIHKTDIQKSDFLLKNWGIYHLHLEKKSSVRRRFTMPNLLFFQVKGQIVHFIDVKPHPKGSNWFDRQIIEIIYSNWPWLLVYMKDCKPLLDIPDDEIHKITKTMGICIGVKDRVILPSNLGVMTSGNSMKAVMMTSSIFNSIKKSENFIKSNEKELKEMIWKETGVKISNLQNFRLEIQDNYVFACEQESQFKLGLFPLF